MIGAGKAALSSALFNIISAAVFGAPIFREILYSFQGGVITGGILGLISYFTTNEYSHMTLFSLAALSANTIGFIASNCQIVGIHAADAQLGIVSLCTEPPASHQEYFAMTGLAILLAAGIAFMGLCTAAVAATTYISRSSEPENNHYTRMPQV